jgi:hypothetical protein
MAYLLLLCLGGFFNLHNFKSKTAHLSDEDMPHRSDGNVMAFIGGAITYGTAMCFLYWLFS